MQVSPSSPIPIPHASQAVQRVLLTGASSQIGHALRAQLRGGGHDMVALSRSAQSNSAVEDAGLHWLQADLADGWPDCGRFDAVVSFGPMQALADALAGLGEAPCRRLVATSSMSAVSKRDAALAADRALSQSLRDAEAALIAQCDRLGIGWTVLRPTMIYGLGIDANLAPIARRAMRTGLFPYPLGRGLRQPVHAGDVALAAWRAVHVDAAIGRTLEVGGGERLRVDRMFLRLRDALPRRTLRLPLPRAVLAIAARLRPSLRGFASRLDQDLVADNTQLTTLLGVAPRGFDPDPAAWLGASA